jgi:hypothetical protein
MWSAHTLAFSSPINNNSTDLDMETLMATDHKFPAVYQNTSSCAGMEKSAVTLYTAVLEECYISCFH